MLRRWFSRINFTLLRCIESVSYSLQPIRSVSSWKGFGGKSPFYFSLPYLSSFTLYCACLLVPESSVKVHLSSKCRVQARLSWLIDNQELSAAATALLSPWDEADLFADPRLVELAVSAFAAADEASNNAKSVDGRKGERRFSSLIWRMSRWARREAVEGDVLRGPSSRSIRKSKRRRDPSDVDRHMEARRSRLAIPDVLSEMDTRREPGFTFWEVSPGVPLRPARAESMASALVLPPSAGDAPGSRSQEDASHRLAGSSYGVANAERLRTRTNRLPRGRWQTILETPKRIWRWISSSQRPARAPNGQQHPLVS